MLIKTWYFTMNIIPAGGEQLADDQIISLRKEPHTQGFLKEIIQRIAC